MLKTIVLLATFGAAPVQIDLAALNAGQLPTAGTLAEADACAAESTYMFFALSSSDKLSAADKKAQLADPWKAWTARAADLRSTTSAAYMNDDAVVTAIISLADIPSDAHFSLHRQCRERLNPAANAE